MNWANGLVVVMVVVVVDSINNVFAFVCVYVQSEHVNWDTRIECWQLDMEIEGESERIYNNKKDILTKRTTKCPIPSMQD